MKRRWWIGLGLVGVIAAAGLLWPSSGKRAGYPFAKYAGPVAQPLWTTPPAEVERALARDAVRLERLQTRLLAAITAARDAEGLLARDRVDDITAEERESIRRLWWGLFEPLLAIDAIKERYEHWYGIDYLNQPRLHARAFSLSFAALCGQVAAGNEFVELVAERKLAQRLFDEQMPSLGLPPGTFSALRDDLNRSRDFAFIPIGSEWYDQWIDRHLDDAAGETVRGLVLELRGRAKQQLDLGAVGSGVKNKKEVLQSHVFSAWFPVQKRAAEWFGDTRVVASDRRLVSDEQIDQLGKALEPGDILVQRRNWYLSNIGLPGFWPHAALYVGSQAQIREAFDDDEAVRERFGTLSEHLASHRPAAWQALGENDADGHPQRIVEAVSEGVIATSLEHSCGADYVAALRPRRSKVDIAIAIDRALGYFGRPYDFNFDFATDDAIVCSELVMKAYEPSGTPNSGLRVPFITVAGRRAIPPTEIVRTFAAERAAGLDRNDLQLDFVYFLDGREESRSAVVADADALAASVDRPKWDVAQP